MSILHKYGFSIINLLEKNFTNVNFSLSTLNTGFVPCRSFIDLFNPGKEERQKSEVAQWCLTLCDPMDYSLPGSSVHGISQARILERVAIPFSRGSYRPRD